MPAYPLPVSRKEMSARKTLGKQTAGREMEKEREMGEDKLRVPVV